MYELPSLYLSVTGRVSGATGFSVWCNRSSCFIGLIVPLNLNCFNFLVISLLSMRLMILHLRHYAFRVA